MTEILLSASLVVYKPDLSVLEQTLLALQRAAQVAKQDYAVRFELTLVDNSHEDDWHQRIQTQVEEYRRAMPDWSLHLLRSPGNVGYGRGNNLVIEQTDSDYHLVINPDLFVEPDMLVQALRFMEANPDAGLLTPAVFGEDGERHYLCKHNPTLFIMLLRSQPFDWVRSLFKSTLAKFEMHECNYDDIIEGVEYPTGCCMFFRTQPLQQINGFDPDYFLHYEDADIGRRMQKIARIVYVPSVRVVHRWARDTHHSWKILFVTIRSGLIYWSKWGGTFCANSSKSAIKNSCKKSVKLNRNYSTIKDSCKKVLVTGANGFIGKSLCANLVLAGCHLCGAIRQGTPGTLSSDVEYVTIGDINEHTDWSEALVGVDVLVHLAARVHVMHDGADDPLTEFRRINVLGTMNLARQAVSAGVRRFIFISSIKVNGESTYPGRPYTADDVPAPVDPYGISKFETEQALHELAEETGIEVVIIRPVMVYGPGVKGNFLAMLHWLKKGIPLPLGAIHNRRSMVALDNLVDLIMTCLHHQKAPGQTLLVSDGEDLSTTELLQRMAAALDIPARLIPMSEQILPAILWIVGKADYTQRLCGFLQVDISKTRELLYWDPPVSIDNTLKQTAQSFLANNKVGSKAQIFTPLRQQ